MAESLTLLRRFYRADPSPRLNCPLLPIWILGSSILICTMIFVEIQTRYQVITKEPGETMELGPLSEVIKHVRLPAHQWTTRSVLHAIR